MASHGLVETGVHREKGQERKARRLDDWSFELRMERLPRASAGASRQARHRRTQYPPIETQPSVQPGDPVYKAPSRKDRLRVFAKARRFAPCDAIPRTWAGAMLHFVALPIICRPLNSKQGYTD
jgi:hypothetical protein